MAIVNIWLTYNGTTYPLLRADRDAMVAHSRTIRDQVAGTNIRPPPQVDLEGAPPGALEHLIAGFRHRRRGQYHVRVNHLPFRQVVDILLGAQSLQIEPELTHVERHMKWYITERRLETEDIVAVHNAFRELADSSELWKHMTQNIAWALEIHKYSDWQGGRLEARLRAVHRFWEPNKLFDAIDRKRAQIEKRKRGRPAQGRNFARYAEQQYREEENARREQERYERWLEDARNGLCVVDDDTIWRLQRGGLPY